MIQFLKNVLDKMGSSRSEVFLSSHIKKLNEEIITLKKEQSETDNMYLCRIKELESINNYILLDQEQYHKNLDASIEEKRIITKEFEDALNENTKLNEEVDKLTTELSILMKNLPKKKGNTWKQSTKI